MVAVFISIISLLFHYFHGEDHHYLEIHAYTLFNHEQWWTVKWQRAKLTLKGNSHQILLSEMSLPGVEVLIEKLLPKILGRLGKEDPSEDDAKLPLYSVSALWRRQFRYDFCTLRTTNQAKIVYACRAAVSVVRYVYPFRNHLSEFLRQFGTPTSAVWRHTTLQPAFWEPSRLRT